MAKNKVFGGSFYAGRLSAENSSRFWHYILMIQLVVRLELDREGLRYLSNMVKANITINSECGLI